MDAERDELVAALRQKLAELDAQVIEFRRERADEFRRYATDLLKPVSDSVTTEVAKIIDGTSSSTAKDFAALYPGFLDAGDGDSILAPPPLSRAQGRRTVSPPPVLYHTSGIPKEGPRRPPSPSSHGRDNEFNGLFTPPFLPLLDSSSDDRRPHNIAGVYNEPATSSAAQRDADAAAATQVAATAAAEATAAEAAAEEAAARAAALTPPPPPEPKLKSALRRTSSISSSRSSTPSIKSPSSNDRHVRFLFDGEEFSPAASPPRPSEQDLSWLMHDDRSGFNAPMNEYDDMDFENAGIQPDYVQNSIPGTTSGHDQDSLSQVDFSSSLPRGDEASDSQQPHSARGWGADGQQTTSSPPGDESKMSAQGNNTAPLASDPVARIPGGVPNQSQATSAPTSPLPHSSSSSAAPRPGPRRQNSKTIDDDEEADFAPLARKISSSDRLRALSKMPLEDPSMWTVVNPQSSPAGSAGMDSPSVNDVISTHSQNRQRRLSQQQEQALTLRRSSTPSPPSVEQVERIGTRNTTEAEMQNGYSSSDDDEGFIAMRPARKPSLSTAPTAPTAPTVPTAPTAPTAPPTVNGQATAQVSAASKPAIHKTTNASRPKKSTSTGKPVQVQFANSVLGDSETRATAAAPEEDDFFEFENDDGLSVGYPLSRSSQVNVEFDDDEPSDAEDELGVEGHAEAAGAVQVPAPAPVNDADLVANAEGSLLLGNDGLDSSSLVSNHRKILGAATDNLSRSSSPPGPPLGISAGSYRGRNIDLFNVVKDPRVLQEATQLGEMESFVGSIHEGHLPSTMAEFSSLTGPERHNLMSGTPRSLTERMAMDDVRKNFLSSSARHY